MDIAKGTAWLVFVGLLIAVADFTPKEAITRGTAEAGSQTSAHVAPPKPADGQPNVLDGQATPLRAPDEGEQQSDGSVPVAMRTTGSPGSS